MFSDYIYRVAAENEVGVAFSGWSYGRTKEGGKCFVMCKEHNVQKNIISRHFIMWLSDKLLETQKLDLA